MMVFFVSMLSIIASCTCIFVIRENSRLVRETRMLYEAIHELFIEAMLREKGEP